MDYVQSVIMDLFQVLMDKTVLRVLLIVSIIQDNLNNSLSMNQPTSALNARMDSTGMVKSVCLVQRTVNHVMS